MISFHAEKDERLWIGTTEAGVFSFDGQHVQLLRRFPGSGRGRAGDRRRNERRVVAGNGARPLRDAIRRIAHIIEDSDARSVVAVPGSQVAWCATDGGGLHKALFDDADGAITARVDMEQGLPSQHVFAILAVRYQPAMKRSG